VSPESFETWYEREHARMVVTLLLATGDLDLASEGVDEACARALARWTRVGSMEAPTGWVYRVGLNHARRLAHRRSRERALLHRFVPPASMPPEASDIWDVVGSLPERQRQVVVLRHVGDLREAEIALVLHISRSTVSTTLRGAHDRLKTLIDVPTPRTADPREIADV
jgi:RNA polymerase sigma-70 factor, ECF subfamily